MGYKQKEQKLLLWTNVQVVDEEGKKLDGYCYLLLENAKIIENILKIKRGLRAYIEIYNAYKKTFRIHYNNK